MAAREIKKDLYSVGAIDWDRRLFDELIPLPDGTSYNSYLLVASEKTVLFDTVDPTKTKELLDNLKELKVKKIDYIVAHHAEQDHSGSIPEVLKAFPGAKVITNPKCKDMLKDLLLIPEERFITVNDRETLSLGDKNLEFIFAPWVHWPETMFSYCREDKVLFTCDFLGSHLATNDLFAKNESKVYTSAKRYYAEIMMPFRINIKKHLTTLKDYDFNMVCPSHGPVYDKPKFILDAYADWVGDKVKNEVVIPYVSMHGSTKAMVDHFVDALEKKKIKVKPYNLTRTDVGDLAMELVDTATIVIASPTVLIGPHPAAVYAAYLANALRPKAKFVSIIGSFGWGGKMVDQLKSLLYSLRVEVIEPVIVKGHPKEADLVALDELAEMIAQKHKEGGIS